MLLPLLTLIYKAKSILKLIYFKVFEIFNYRAKSNLSEKFTLKKVNSNTFSEGETFFGYYDKYPENIEGTHIIYHGTLISTNKEPDPMHPISILLQSKRDNVVKKVDDTVAYNWQQGSRLMWLDNNHFIYNIYKKGSFCSVRYCLKTDEKFYYPFSINDCYGDNYSLTLNYSRLNNLRPDYGYRNKQIDFFSDINDGIYYNDHKTKTQGLLISIEELKLKTDPKYYKFSHWVNHIMINPDGDRFIFLHRWSIKATKRYDRLYLYDFSTKSLECISDYGMVSHMTWVNNENLFGFLNGPEGPSYYSINIKSKKFVRIQYLGFNRDGHPSVTKRFTLTDTYPNKKRLKKLLLYSFEKKTTEEIGVFKEGTRYWGETRCDLHPRISDNSENIYIDSVHEGRRNLYSIVPRR